MERASRWWREEGANRLFVSEIRLVEGALKRGKEGSGVGKGEEEVYFDAMFGGWEVEVRIRMDCWCGQRRRVG